ncbi:head GIN domain-containing protein [Gallaecimonas sp. GXIMD1310]|uniref:head GIN domain-containing protein n=1 Tax=Gallaecimonas sp. GXIMD1310 TaxID=3131926 RepID=UPI003251F0AD
MKPKHLVLATAGLLLLSAHFSAFAWWGSDDVKGNGDVTTVEHAVSSDVDEVEIALPAQVTIDNGSGDMRIEAEKNLMPYIVVKVSGDELSVRSKRGYDLRPSKPIVIHIHLKQLEKLSAAGSGSVNVGDFSGEHLKLDMAGSGNVTMNSAQYQHLDADVAGSGSVTINSGKVDRLSLDIAGSGSLHAFGLKSRRADVDIAGSGKVQLSASDKLSIDIAGSGNIEYIGSPEVSPRILGSGTVTRKQ